MIKVENIVTPSPENWEIVIHGMRNAFKSWDKDDSGICKNSEEEKEICFMDCPYVEEWVGEQPYADPLCNYNTYEDGAVFILGKNDKNLFKSLCKLGSSDRKLLRQLPIIMEITAPEYWYRQFDTYKIGTTANSTSQMHTLLNNKFSVNDFSFEAIPGYKRIIDQEFPKFSEEELANEDWVDLGNGYKVSNLGRMTGVMTDILQPVITAHGYCAVTMQGKIYKLHRIVADVFCPKRPEANIVNHKNGNKLDNRAENLEWVTQKENIKHSRENNLQGPTMKTYKGKFTEEQREEIIDKYNTGNYSLRQLGKEYGVSHTCIREMVKGIHKYKDKRNYFELMCIPLIEFLNELRDRYLISTDETKKEEIWHTILKLIPQSFNYTRTVSLNYEVALNMIMQRYDHPLTEWHTLIQFFIDNLPYFKVILEALGMTGTLETNGYKVES